MDWFQRLTGFVENHHTYAEVQRRFAVEGETLRCHVNGRKFGIGRLELVSLQALRARALTEKPSHGSLRISTIRDDVRRLHALPEYSGALFQVASQFNLLEMINPEVVPEDGVTRYSDDPTQGPACAIAAGAGTIYRNYLVPVGGKIGQSRDNQIDALADLRASLAAATGRPVSGLWDMKNGYAMAKAEGLRAINAYLQNVGESELNDLRGRIQIGLHWDVEVTDGDHSPGPTVSQAFCSALPVAYCKHPFELWQPLAVLALEAAYEATLLAALANARRGVSNIVLLTRLGGGAFGNPDAWIDGAIQRASCLASGFDLDIRHVSRR